MIQKSTLTAKYQITLPGAIRQHSGAHAGAILIFQVTDDGHVAIDIVAKPTAERLRGRLHRPGLRYVPYGQARRQAQDEGVQASQTSDERQ